MSAFPSPTLGIACILIATTCWISRHAIKDFYQRTVEAWQFLMNGRHVIETGVNQNPHSVFSVKIPGSRLHVATSKEQWADINNAHGSELSPNAASREMFQPKYTFGYDWDDRRDVVGMPLVRAIRTISNRVADLRSVYVGLIDDEFKRAVNAAPLKSGYKQVPLFATVQLAATRMATLSTFGVEAANDREFITRGIAYTKEVSSILEVVRLVPEFLRSPVTKLIKGKNPNQTYVYDVIGRLIEKRLEQLREGGEVQKPTTISEAYVDTWGEEWPVQKFVVQLVTLWVTTVLAVPIVVTHLFQDIFIEGYPELRDEVYGVLEDPSADLNKLPLFESFLMESFRTKCFQTMTAHRVAIKPFTFSDGYTVPVGESVEFNQRSGLKDSNVYPNPEEFDPMRFHNRKMFTDTGLEWPFWGVPKLTCPGRFQVSNMLKLMGIYIMTNWDCKLESTSDLNFTWRDCSVPNPKTMVLMKERS